jgi:AcrR family transcriptional regulator
MTDSDTQQKIARRAGRHRDDQRNPQILRAALEVLAEVGYDCLTMDAVAERVQAGKATLYRRWSSKAQLVVDALAYIDPAAICAKRANRGSLRADLCDLLAIYFGQNDPVKQRVITGLASALCRHADLAEAWRSRFVEGQRCVLYAAYEQAAERGEIPPGLNLDVLTTVGPALLFYRLVMTDQEIDQEFIGHVVDEVLLPLCSERLTEPRQTPDF